LELWGSCPFHSDSNPSFSITPKEDGEVWYCFSCKRGGGPVEFLAALRGISKEEARKRWRRICGEPEPEPPLERRLLSEFVAAVETDEIPFLLERGISRETLKRYRIGYMEDIDKTLAILGVGAKEAEEAGMSMLSRAIVYPFEDAEGVFRIKVRGVDSKIYLDHKSPAHRQSLWGLAQLPKVDEVFLFEGMNDVLMADTVGMKALALGGTTFHPVYWEELCERNISRVVLVPDGDVGGRDLLRRLFISGYPRGLSLEVVALPEGDPDDWLADGRYREWQRMSLLEWYVKASGPVPSPPGRERLLRDVASFLTHLDPSEKAINAKALREYLDPQDVELLVSDVKPDLEAEQMVLSNMALSEQVRAETASVLKPDHFHGALQRAFAEILDGRTHTRAFVEPDLVNYRRYVDRVFEVRQRKLLLEAIDRSRSSFLNEDPETATGALVEKLYQVTDSSEHVHSGAEVMKGVMRDVAHKVLNPSVTGIPLGVGFPTLNRVLLGFVPGKFILLSGNTGHGKTTVVCNWVDDLVFVHGEQVLFVSLEMSPSELMERQLAIRTGISSTKITTGSLQQTEYDQLVKESKVFLTDRLHIVWKAYELSKIIAIIKSMVLRKKARVVVLDYLQLIQVGNRKDRWEQLMDITKELKTHVCPMGVTVVAVSQLRRAALASNVPEASDQSGSYGMLADVDVAITIKRKSITEVKGDGSNFLFYVDKHRYNVDQVLVDAMFDRQTLRIREV